MTEANRPEDNQFDNADYGSTIDESRSSAIEESNVLDERSDEDRVSSWLSITGRLALLAAIFLFLLQGSNKPTATTNPQSNHNLHQVKMLGKVKRSPSDTPFVFSQRVDHLDDSNQDTFQQRYYRKSEFFKGPGHPIFLINGGEGAMNEGLFYPFVDTFLAKKFGAYVLHPEHRFYGQSQPVDALLLTHDDLKKYHTARQAMLDFITIVKTYQEKLGCSPHKHSKHYCPVISVGGSYPGFLSAVMRLHYPDTIDIGYASSAPLLLYSMDADQWGYMEKVTKVTDSARPGCAEAVRQTLAEVHEAILASDDYVQFAHEKLNVCPGTLPVYIHSNDLLSKEAMMIVEYTFADMNMGFYPPDDTTDLVFTCDRIFQNETMDSFGKIQEFWKHLEDNIDTTLPCFDMSSQMPDGPRATISGSDWSGVGPGYDGMMFDFHCCSTLTPALGFSHKSMFPYRKWTLEWLTEHCLDRFDVVPDPLKLVHEFKFDDLVGQGASRILFTNGMNDIWSEGSYLESLSDSIIAINMPNGAHHSELYYMNEDGIDTDDVMQAHDDIADVLEGWLKEIKKKMVH
ncbi:Lysosomal Pro-X carboxypeptidase [Seminavis robusta]|uniref:Lysosomal Pro-X carboxypeptidase n=1 Tax=Seminavis robusta TaxID=568900 RepID=A0A9N8H8V8_9STRA|nr:Lysosomal Pro-X carboxypeptidase [Seminavis robusta]|eukprot:Sro101_g051530.1 Lysosomal Pro-X carboxypeptidase (570) ;mRNA; r:38636-40531